MNQVINADCIEAMQQLPDKSIDLILCDLPYQMIDCAWDSIIPFDKLWIEYKRLIKAGGAIVLTASQPFTSALIMSNPRWFKSEWIWKKNRCSNFALAKFHPLKQHESIIVFGNPNGKVNYYPQGLIQCDYNKSNSTKRNLQHIKSTGKTYKQTQTNYPKTILEFDCEIGLHPSQKPVKLFEYLISSYSKEGDLVLDNCAGSGTTAIACINTKRNYIIIERDETYYKNIVDRITNHLIS